MNTFLATACAVLAWTFGEWMFKGKPSMLGAASGAVAGLVAITPAAGNVGICGAFVIGTRRRLRVPVGGQPAEAHAGRGRRARRVRRARGRRHTGRAADRRVQQPVARRAGPRHRLGHRQGRLQPDHGPVRDPGEGGRRDDRSGRRSSRSSPSRSPTSSSGCARPKKWSARVSTSTSTAKRPTICNSRA